MIIKHKLRVLTPSGNCPVKLEGTDDASIRSWVREVRAARPQYHFTKGALKYWVQHTYPWSTPECTHVRARLDELIKG